MLGQKLASSKYTCTLEKSTGWINWDSTAVFKIVVKSSPLASLLELIDGTTPLYHRQSDSSGISVEAGAIVESARINGNAAGWKRVI